MLRWYHQGAAAVDADAFAFPDEVGQTTPHHPQPLSVRDHRAGGEPELPESDTVQMKNKK